MAKSKAYELVYEDDAIVIVNKAPGVLTTPDRFVKEIPNLYKMLKTKYGEIYTVHRLDKDTSGILCFAKTPEAHKILNHQFQKRETTKKYVAIVDGVPFQTEGTIDSPIGENPSKPGTMMVTKRGKKSISNYKVKTAFKNYSLVEVDILTGRTHQIRVHLASVGHPMVVDPLYGQRTELFLSSIKRRKFNLAKGTEEKPVLTRVPLHAASLSFTHPSTNEKVEYDCAAPKDMRALVNQLTKWDK